MRKEVNHNQVKDTLIRLDLVESKKDELVDMVESFIEEREKKYGDKAIPEESNKGLGNTQFQDLVGKASSTRSVREIINFIKYQIGRDKNRNGWGNNNFGEDVIKKIDEVLKMAGSDPELRIQLVRLFLGYLQRHVRFVRAVK